MNTGEYIQCMVCGKKIEKYEFYRTHVSCPVGATEGRPARFASSSGSASAAPSVQEPSCGVSAPEVTKPSNTGKEDGPLDLSRAVQLPVSGLAAAVKIEIAILAKEIELMQLRGNESEDDPRRAETLRSFGNCLWRHKRDLLKALAAASAPSAAGASGGS